MEEKPVALDLFCGAGGCTKGYQQAGFYVIGVDIKPQPRYVGDEFYVGDALDVLEGLIAGEWRAKGYRWGSRQVALAEIALIHASPPCQAYSVLNRAWGERTYVELIPSVREALIASQKPYVIENVMGAPLEDPVKLCGSMFGLGIPGKQLRRHRLFESNFRIAQPWCDHYQESVGVYGHGGATPRYTFENGRKNYVNGRRGGYQATYAEARIAMNIFWMRHPELTEAIPPAYTEHIGRSAKRHLFPPV